jgi:hypothetical protein
LEGALMGQMQRRKRMIREIARPHKGAPVPSWREVTTMARRGPLAEAALAMMQGLADVRVFLGRRHRKSLPSVKGQVVQMVAIPDPTRTADFLERVARDAPPNIKIVFPTAADIWA